MEELNPATRLAWGTKQRGSTCLPGAQKEGMATLEYLAWWVVLSMQYLIGSSDLNGRLPRWV